MSKTKVDENAEKEGDEGVTAKVRRISDEHNYAKRGDGGGPGGPDGPGRRRRRRRTIAARCGRFVTISIKLRDATDKYILILSIQTCTSRIRFKCAINMLLKVYFSAQYRTHYTFAASITDVDQSVESG